MKQHIILLGSPAVGKQTIGRALGKSLTAPVFENAKVVDLAMLIYCYGSNEFRQYRDSLRKDFYDRFLKNTEHKLLISTYVLRHKENWSYFDYIEQKFQLSGWSTVYILLTADRETLIHRVQDPSRKEKLSIQTPHAMEEWLDHNPYHSDLCNRQALHINTSNLSIEESKNRILTYLQEINP